jgi:hypothetical protein
LTARSRSNRRQHRPRHRILSLSLFQNRSRLYRRRATPLSRRRYKVRRQAYLAQLRQSATRPRPVINKKTTPHHTFFIGNLWTTIKFKVLGDSKKGADPRQKKALILVVGLVVVLVIVLRFALGSGMSGAKAALKKTGTTEASSSNLQSANIENWQKPEIYPLSLRDPMKPSSNASTSNGLFEGEVTVRGIVYSSDKPSAIIADQIVSEGDIILGVKILKIGKDFVAFEKDGKRWQQQVRQ